MDIDGFVDKLECLSLTSNIENPLDIKTAFGKQATIHMVLRYFSDHASIQRLVSGPDYSAYNDVEDFNHLTNQWRRELRAMIDKRHSIEFERTDDEHKNAGIILEQMLDN